MAATLALATLQPTVTEDFPWRKPLIGLTFALICSSGMLAALFPRKCSGGSHFAERAGLSEFKGHHLGCDRFAAHTITVRGHTLCAACVGLFLGALVALFGTLTYFFVGWKGIQAPFEIVLAGEAGVVSGFLQIKSKGITRSLLNAFLVLGAYLVLVGIDMLTRSLVMDLYVISLIIAWIWTRILLSKWDHRKICQTCQLDCEL